MSEPSPVAAAAPVASHRVADALAERILSGELPPGTRIKQDELAAELQSSRIPVREALRILAARGLVTLRANSGAWVTRMSLQELEVSYKIRERLEPLLLEESLPRLTDAHVEKMRSLQDEIEADEDVERFLVLDRELHWTSYGGHEAPQLADMIGRLWDTTQHYRRAFTRLAGRQRAWIIAAEHRLLIEAVAERDAVAACNVLAQHIRRTRVELADHAELFSDGPDHR
ncbi:MAG: GntR family transcriptional regulator [Nocardioides sp.]